MALRRSYRHAARGTAMFALDLLLAGLAWFVALKLLVSFETTQEYGRVALESLPVVLATYGLSLFVFRVHRVGVRLGSQEDLLNALYASLVPALALPAALFLLRLGWEVSPAACFFSPVLTGVLMLAVRVALRAWKERSASCISRWQASPVVILGAGTAGQALVEELDYDHRWYAVALLDDDRSKHGRAIHGVRVLGCLDDVARVFRRLGATHAVLAMPAASPASRRRAVDLCHAAAIPVLTVPGLDDLQARRRGVFELRRPRLPDLIGSHVRLDFPALRSFITRRTVLVSGAAKLVGLQICYLVSLFRPAKLVLCDADDAALYSAQQEFNVRPYLRVEVVFAQCDPMDSARAAEIFAKHRPDIVFHAVPFSPLPLAESENAFQIARKTVLGPAVIMQAAIDAAAHKFVLISTDKAMNSTSVVGASARLAELVCHRLTERASVKLMVVRLGDVLGEPGGVLARIEEQVSRRSPLTVPLKEVERCFLAADEAARIALLAAMMGQGGEIYAADMAEPVNISHLAKQLALLSGMTDRAIRMQYVDAPGDAANAEDAVDLRKTASTVHPRLRLVKQTTCAHADLLHEVRRWLHDSRSMTREATLEKLHAWIRVCEGGTVSGEEREVVQRHVAGSI
jgi:FlaA1/EpsC-like NDP-sugar epimerase